jgi:hypothetical protein
MMRLDTAVVASAGARLSDELNKEPLTRWLHFSLRVSRLLKAALCRPINRVLFYQRQACWPGAFHVAFATSVASQRRKQSFRSMGCIQEIMVSLSIATAAWAKRGQRGIRRCAAAQAIGQLRKQSHRGSSEKILRQTGFEVCSGRVNVLIVDVMG